MSSQRPFGVALILYAIGFNLPYAWLAANFSYPQILREPAGEVLAAFTAGGGALILAWFAFMAAALLLAPVAVGLAKATDGSGGVAALGVAAGVTQAIGLCRWVYAVPGLAAAWGTADPAGRAGIEATFQTLHQFAGVGVGETIGQSLTAFWLIGVGMAQARNRRFGRAVGAIAILAAAILLLGQIEGLSTTMAFAPGIFGFGALAGFLLLTLWLIWTGILLIARRAEA
jgi:hypothetical protein